MTHSDPAVRAVMADLAATFERMSACESRLASVIATLTEGGHHEDLDQKSFVPSTGPVCASDRPGPPLSFTVIENLRRAPLCR